ncbi:hypothetical protein A2U01_0010859 [Trifolium medium]|uniref:Uncharacterized protein n=1 Tax=Trifolium medium TaxID=97028 RepID=A0A392MUI0_9FABA|nr:hypothetical protein [Trifolium medium]
MSDEEDIIGVDISNSGARKGEALKSSVSEERTRLRDVSFKKPIPFLQVNLSPVHIEAIQGLQRGEAKDSRGNRFSRKGD